jgi:DNA repair protein RecO (recombination protein O)
MPLHEAEAIVLRQYSLSDSDRIIVCVTREFGKVRGVAKGVKRPNSRIAGSLEPLNHIRLEFFVKEGRELHQIRQADLIHSYLGKNPSLDQVYAFSYFAELANEIVQDNQCNQPLFRLLLACLEAGAQKPINQSLVLYYGIWSLKLSGLLPNHAYCSNCGKCVKKDSFFAWIESGHVRCQACAHGRGLKIRGEAAAALDAMMTTGPGPFMAQPLSRDSAAEIERLSQRLLGLQLEKELKSYHLLKEIFWLPEDSNAT